MGRPGTTCGIRRRAGLLGLTLVATLGAVGCVTTTRRIAPDIEEILAEAGLEIEAPPGWRLHRSPMYFLDSALFHLTSPDGMVVAVEVSSAAIPDLEAHVRRVREQYVRAFPTGQFHPVREVIGSHPAQGFDGAVLRAEDGGQRLNVFYRCLNAAGRSASLQAQAPAGVWSLRREELARSLATFRLNPKPAAR